MKKMETPSKRRIVVGYAAHMTTTPLAKSWIRACHPFRHYEEEHVEDFYNKIQNTIDKVPKKDILLVQGDWNAKVGNDAHEN